uniref:GDNF/GAS1 domain-containing protein n=1 Tax=Anopheles atroparvus TaxID=41427 RepID=A0A182JCZ0_ANOAO
MLDVLPSALDTSSGTATNSIYPNFYPSDIIEDPPPTSTYPYFLFPSKKYPPSAFGAATIYHATVDYINLPDGGVLVGGSGNGTTDHEHSSSSSSANMFGSAHRPNHAGTEHGYRTRYEHNFDTSMHHSQHPITTHSNSKHNAPTASGEHQPHGHGSPDQQHQHHQHQHGRNGTVDSGGLGSAGRWDSMSVPSDLQQQPETVRAMGVDDNYHRLLDQNMALIETPLVAPPHAYFPQHYKTALYPYNVSGYHHAHQHGAGGHFGPPHQHQHHQHPQHPYEYDGGLGGGGGGGGGVFDDGAGGYLASSAGSAPVDNILISLNGGNGDAAIEFEGSSYEHTVDKQFGSDDIEEKEAEMSFIHFQSTCHLALHSCRDDQVCSSALKTVMMHCDQHRCNRNACMESLQSFYKSIHDDLSLDIAFCLCRKTPNRHDMCMSAQEKLHPACAQRPPESLAQQSSSQAGNGVTYNAPPACHMVAELCREDEDCRARLEVFEQSCAVDSVTKKCAGKTSACRQAMLGILGTPLRTTCACQGSDMQQLYDCLGWQRLLWLNPCYRPKPTEVHTIETNYVETPDTRPETLLHKQNELIERTDLDHGQQHRPQQPDEYDRSGTNSRHQPQPNGEEDDGDGQYENKMHQRPDEQVLHVPSTQVTEVETFPPTTVTTTTTEPTTTPVPIRYCVVQRSHQPDQLIAEGKSRRLYILDDAECSELCTCGGGDSLTLTCHALCVPLAPCRTALAYYSHAAPAYQAFRGRCLCYSGRFICMRPPPGEYLLPGGIFLLLGYSSTDEALLRPHTNLGVQDAVRALQQYVLHHIDNSTLCTLTLFNITEENIILSIRLPLDPKLTSMQLLKLEKDQCTRILETISHQINTQYVELSAHRLLSIFKMAEVQIVWPEVSHAHRYATPSVSTGVLTSLLILCGTLLPSAVRWMRPRQAWPALPRAIT